MVNKIRLENASKNTSTVSSNCSPQKFNILQQMNHTNILLPRLRANSIDSSLCEGFEENKISIIKRQCSIPEYYMARLSERGLKTIDIFDTIRDSIRNFRKLTSEQLEYMSVDSTSDEKYEIICLYDQVMYDFCNTLS